MKSNALTRSTTRTRLVVNCGLMIAISVVLKLVFEMYIPLGGFPSLRLNLTALPLMLSGILLGPVAGFIVGFISDLLCFIIKPGGPFFIGFTFASALTGFIPGLIWLLLKKYPLRHLEWFNLAFVTITAGILLYFKVFTFSDGVIYYAQQPLNPVIFGLFVLLLVGFVVFPLIVVKRTGLSPEYRSDHVLFVVSITQIIASIAVLLPARVITNIFLIPLYTIAIAGLLKILPGFIRKY